LSARAGFFDYYTADYRVLSNLVFVWMASTSLCLFETFRHLLCSHAVDTNLGCQVFPQGDALDLHSRDEGGGIISCSHKLAE